jgi:hypothetical protein
MSDRFAIAYERRVVRELARTDGPPAGWQARVRFRIVQKRTHSLRGPVIALGFVLAFLLGFAAAHLRRRPIPASAPPAAFSTYVDDAICRSEAERDLAETPAERERYQTEVETLRKLRHQLNPSRPYIEAFPETTDPMEGIPRPRVEPGFDRH